MKKMIYKLLAVVMITGLLISSATPAFAKNPERQFTDVPSYEVYYYDALQWGISQGIVNGYPDGTFRPDATMTLAEACVMLYRFAGSPDIDRKFWAQFSSHTEDWNMDALGWANKNELYNGTYVHSPEIMCSRRMAMSLLWNYEGRATVRWNPFDFLDTNLSDGTKDPAIAWAQNICIVTGVESGLFYPEYGCTRAQFLTILWRYHKFINRLDEYSRLGKPYYSFDKNDVQSIRVCYRVYNSEDTLVGYTSIPLESEEADIIIKGLNSFVPDGMYDRTNISGAEFDRVEIVVSGKTILCEIGCALETIGDGRLICYFQEENSMQEIHDIIDSYKPKRSDGENSSSITDNIM